MAIAFSTRGLGPDDEVAGIVSRAQTLDLRSVYFSRPVPRAAHAHSVLRGAGVSVVGVGVEDAADRPDFGSSLQRAARCASATRASAVVVEGGGVEPDGREPAADRLVRALHGPQSKGVPLALRNGGGAADLLGFEEIGWVLGELPQVGVWFDPLHAWMRSEANEGPPFPEWVDAFAGRAGGVFIHGAGSDGTGGSHPIDGGPDWSSFAAALPARVPWVLDLDRGVAVGEVADALRWMRSLKLQI